MSRRSIFACALAAIIALSGCGGSGDQTKTSNTNPTITMSEAEVLRAAKLPLDSTDIASAVTATNANPPNTARPTPSSYAGNPDVLNVMRECKVAQLTKAANPATGIGLPVLVPDPVDGKNLTISSSAAIEPTQESAQKALTLLQFEGTPFCMQRAFEKTVEAQRSYDKAIEALLTVDPLTLPGLGGRTAAFRFHVTVNRPLQPRVDQWADVMVTFIGRTQMLIIVNSSDKAPSDAFDLKLVERARTKALQGS